jgi:Leucine-rich repeat (LRR) protein
LLQELYLQNNLLTSFEYLDVQPRLKEIRVQNNHIVSFKGFLPQPRLEVFKRRVCLLKAMQSVWLEGNPITQHHLYPLMVYILQQTSSSSICLKIDEKSRVAA